MSTWGDAGHMGRLFGGGLSRRGYGGHIGPFGKTGGWGSPTTGAEWVMAIIVALLIAAGVWLWQRVGDVFAHDTRHAAGAHKVSDPVRGAFRRQNVDALRRAKMRASTPSCRWIDSHVHVSFTLHRGRTGVGAATKAEVGVAYRIEGHPHGDSTFITVVLPRSNSSRAYNLDAGHPKSIRNGASISACEPSIFDIS